MRKLLLAAALGIATSLSAQSIIPEARATQHLRFGGEASLPVPITTIASVVVLPSRHFLVLDYRARTISRFDAEGKFVNIFARRGAGPGELGDASLMGLNRDTIWVYQSWYPTDKLAQFAVDGRFISQRNDVDPKTTTGLSGSAITAARALPLAVVDRGHFVTHFLAGKPEDADPVFGVMYANQSMTAVDTIVKYPLSRRLWRYGARWSATNENAFADFPLVAVQQGGTHALILDRSAGATALGVKRVEIASKLTEYSVSLPLAPRPLSRAEVDSTLRAQAELTIQRAGPMGARLGTPGEFAERIREGTRIPQNAPLASELVAGIDGSAWVKLWGTAPAWIVFDSTGKPVQRVTLPRGSILLAAQADYAWCVINDANDVPWITTFRITR